eukprot:6236136-Amphidinium_carterae.1
MRVETVHDLHHSAKTASSQLSFELNFWRSFHLGHSYVRLKDRCENSVPVASHSGALNVTLAQAHTGQNVVNNSHLDSDSSQNQWIRQLESAKRVMSEISQTVKSVIRCAIRVSTMRNQRKVRSESMSQNENQSKTKTSAQN